MLDAVRARLSYFLSQDLTLPPELKGLNLGRIRISKIPDHPFKAIQLDASDAMLTQKAVLNFFDGVRELQNEGEEIQVITKKQMVFLKASEMAKYELTRYEKSTVLTFVKKAEEATVINTICVTSDWNDFPEGESLSEIILATTNLNFMVANCDICDLEPTSEETKISFMPECTFAEKAQAIRHFAQELTTEE